MALEYKVAAIAVEALSSGRTDTTAEVAEIVVEALTSGAAATTAQIAEIAVEVLRSITTLPTVSRRRQIVNG